MGPMARTPLLPGDLNDLLSGGRISSEVFLTIHNIFNGSQYLIGDFKNPRRWLEAGLKVNFL